MSAKSDTWMAFYVGDYLANTLHLGREHHGSYLMLILAAFKTDGWLPTDDGLLAQVAKVTPEQWTIERAMYARFFDVTSDRWTHRRVTRELEKAERMTVQRSAAGIASAAKRQRNRQREGNDRSTSVAVPLQQKGIPSPSPSHDPKGSGADAPKAHSLPADWKPSEDLRQYAISKGHDPDVVAKAFVDYWTGSKGKKTKRESWARTFEVWCDRETPKRAAATRMLSFDEQKRQQASSVVSHDSVDQWRTRLKGWKPGKWWPENIWGPRPGMPGCRVPQTLLAGVGT